MKSRTRIQRGILLAAGALLFADAAYILFHSLQMPGSPFGPILFATLLFVGATAYFFFAQEQKDSVEMVWQMAILAGLLIVRFAMLPHQSHDYQEFLSNWVSQMREAPGLSALKMDIGDYNMPYLYLLFLIAKTSAFDIYYIKLFSVAFDLLAALFAVRLVRRKVSGTRTAFAVFAVVLAAPTVLLNSAYWGQCDSVYTALALGGIVFALEGKSRRAWLMLALAFSFKLQTIFFFPAFLVLMLVRRIRWQDIWVFPAGFAATLLPAITAGKPIAETLSIYGQQTSQYAYLLMNAPSVFRLFGTDNDFAVFNAVGIFLAGTACAALLYLLWCRRDTLTDDRLIEAAFLFTLIIPYFLPRMHDRYFFAADILSIVCFFYNKKRWYLPIAVVGASYTAYYYYLMGSGELISPVIPSLVLLGVILESAARLLRPAAAPISPAPAEPTENP